MFIKFYTRVQRGIKVACQRSNVFFPPFFAFCFRRSPLDICIFRASRVLEKDERCPPLVIAVSNEKEKTVERRKNRKKHLDSSPILERNKNSLAPRERERDSCSATSSVKCGRASILYNPPHNPPSLLRTLDAAALKEVLFKVIQLPPP